MKVAIIFILILFFNLSLFSTNQVDSLKAEVENSKSDSMKVKNLILLWEATAYNNPKEAVTYASKALEISQNANYRRGIAESLQRLAAGYAVRNINDSAKILYDSSLRIYSNLGDAKMEGVILGNLAMLHYGQGEYLEALLVNEDALSKSSEVDDEPTIALSLQLHGNIHHYMGNYEEAQKYLIQAQRSIEKIDKNSVRYADGLVYLATNLMSQKKYTEALENLSEAKILYREKEDYFFLAQALNNSGYIHFKQKNFDTAIVFLEEASELSEKYNNNAILLLATNTMGLIAKENGNYKKARERLNEALKISESINDQQRIAMVSRNLGDLEADQNNLFRAKQLYNKALEIGKEIGSKSSLQETYLSLSNASIKAGSFEESLKYYKLFTKMKDSIYDENKINKMEEMEARFDKEKKEKEIAIQKSKIELLSKDLQIESLRQQGLVAGLLLILITGSVIIYLQRKTMRRNKQIRAKEKELEKEKLKTSELKKNKIEKELEYKRNELTSHALQIAQKNELLDKLRHTIREIELKSATDQKQFRDLRFMINGSAQTDKDWDNFNKHFEQVHQNFYTKLKSHQQELTGNDLRLSAMLRMNLSTKEVASILNISPESVKKARYRLKKKLQLKEEKDLHSFMMEV